MFGRDVLYFYYSGHCAACASAKPILDAFERKHRGEITIIRLNLDFRDWAIDGWQPKFTPGYQLVRDRITADVSDKGVLTEAQLEKLVFGGQTSAKAKRSLQPTPVEPMPEPTE